MVKLTEKLLEILDSRKDEWAGDELKMIAEAIAISEAIIEKVPVDKNAKTEAELIREWRGE